VTLNKRLAPYCKLLCLFRREQSVTIAEGTVRRKMSINGDVMSDVDLSINDESLATDPTEVHCAWAGRP